MILFVLYLLCNIFGLEAELKPAEIILKPEHTEVKFDEKLFTNPVCHHIKNFDYEASV